MQQRSEKGAAGDNPGLVEGRAILLLILEDEVTFDLALSVAGASKMQ
jgi:hypothetical protein